MKNVDKVIKTIYLASSDVREDMMASLVENVLYSWNEPITLQDIHSTICDEFNIIPSKNEVRETIDALLEKNLITAKSSGYILTQVTKQAVDQKVKQNDEADQTRYINFERVLLQIYPATLNRIQREDLWKVYNDYINECFLQYQRDAIEMLMRNSEMKENGGNLVKRYADTLNDVTCKSIFNTLVASYPNYLSEADLNHIGLIADRTERFFSLGLPEEDYLSATEFNVSKWVLIADTNVLYSILKLRAHAEGEACLELAEIAKTGLLGFRIAYLPLTLSELKAKKPDLEERVVDANFTNNQLKALRDSGKLDPFVQPYYDRLTQGQAVTPAERIEKSQYILKNENIEIYNPKQLINLAENGEYIASKYGEYYDYERFRNDARIAKGLEERKKNELQVEHDIILREVILALRDGSTSLAEVKQIGLTLDEGLLRFDQYMIRRQRLPINTAPTFFLPSMLLRRLRSFIPLKTNDYRKAFFRAVSTKTFDPENGQLSIAIQRSVAYFNALGIDNPKVMMQMLHDEIFLSGLEEAHIQGKVEEFTKSELDRKFGNMEKYIETLSSKIEAFAAENEQQVADFQQQKNWFSEENEKVKRLAKAKIDEQYEEKQKINLLHTQELNAERERSRLEQEKLKMEKELETNKSLLIKLDPIVERLSLQNKKLDERAKIHLSLFSAGIGIIISISILLFKSELIEIKKFTGDIYFAFILPVALFGFAYWVRMGKKFTDDHENIRIRLIRWYRKGLNSRNDFDPDYHQSLLDETERLRIEVEGGTNSVMKLISQKNK